MVDGSWSVPVIAGCPISGSKQVHTGDSRRDIGKPYIIRGTDTDTITTNITTTSITTITTNTSIGTDPGHLSSVVLTIRGAKPLPRRPLVLPETRKSAAFGIDFLSIPHNVACAVN
jgi:hypothetical protein